METKIKKSKRIPLRVDRLIHSKIKALASIRLSLLDDIADAALLEYFEKHKSELIK